MCVRVHQIASGWSLLRGSTTPPPSLPPSPSPPSPPASINASDSTEAGGEINACDCTAADGGDTVDACGAADVEVVEAVVVSPSIS